jgi:uncharacterized membrane protein YeaQ/YmgE (transglycosylase-associated protein family)
MTDKPYFEETRESSIRGWILGLMMKGAGWAAALVFGVIGVLVALRLFARLLPENPNAALDSLQGGADLLSRLV